MNTIPINHIKIQFFDGTYRIKAPEETYKDIRDIMDEIGVTDITDITSVDRLDIPVYCAVRPRAARGVSKVHWGKGKEPIHAEVSAMMEAIERFSAEYQGSHLKLASYEELGLTKAVDPHDLILPKKLEIGEKIHWTLTRDILNDEDIYVPSNAIYHPYDPLGMANHLFRSDSNGLASGNVIEEAILHAIYEVVERDALSIAERNRSLGKRLTITPDCPARHLLETFENDGIKINLWLLDGKTKIPTVAAAADDTVTKNPAMLVIGSGTHAHPEIAALRALSEVAQSRASELHLEHENIVNTSRRREIIEKAGYERMKRINRMWFAEAGETDINTVQDLSSEYLDENITHALEEISHHAERVCVCNMSKTKIPVVRVVIPGFEVSYMDSSRKPVRN
ncbi:MAG: YcaO-related McrA-glycine thioamidation protein [Euryarchaeota archaeon]|nr:YcaO-related McrA-glycine thioamidation protein [Euryarchaeota archaeon]